MKNWKNWSRLASWPVVPDDKAEREALIEQATQRLHDAESGSIDLQIMADTAVVKIRENHFVLRLKAAYGEPRREGL